MKSKIPLTLLVVGLTAVSANAAAIISFVGTQTNVDAKEKTLPTVADSSGWRNSTPSKPLDIDGDNILGTDGYYLRSGNTSTSISYLTVAGVTNIVGGGNNFGYMDDPSDPTGIDNFRVGFWGTQNAGAQDLASFVIGTSGAVGATIRVGVQFVTYQTGTQTLTLSQTIGGTATDTSTTLTFADDGYDFAFFDIKDAAAGDKFTLSGALGTNKYLQYGGLTFDSIPEPSAALLGGLGMLLLLRRRRA